MKKLVFSSMVLVASLLSFGTGYADGPTPPPVDQTFCNNYAEQFGTIVPTDQKELVIELRAMGSRTACELAPHATESCVAGFEPFVEHCPVPEQPTPPPPAH